MPQIEKPDQIYNQSQIWSSFLYARQSPSIMETAEKSPAAKLNENLARWFSGLCIWQNQNVYASLRTIPIFGLSHGFPILETFRIQSCQMPIKKNGHFNASVSLVQNVQVKDSLRYNGRRFIDLHMKKKFHFEPINCSCVPCSTRCPSFKTAILLVFLAISSRWATK